MKVTISVTLSEDLLDDLDKRSGEDGSRSELIEAAVRAFIVQHKNAKQKARDLTIINRLADRLNKEAADVLEYQSLF